MPNWVENRVSIYGPKDRIEQMRNLLVEPHPLKTNADGIAEGGFTFLNLICPPKRKWKDYNCGAIGLAEHKDNPYNWYDWNIDNWGTKWDAVDVEMSLDDTVEQRANLHLTFLTAWSPPGPIMVEIYKLCQEMRLGLDWGYLEEQGWGGMLEINEVGDGGLEYWDIPEYDVTANDFAERVVQTIDVGEWVRQVSAEIEDTKRARQAIRDHFGSKSE